MFKKYFGTAILITVFSFLAGYSGSVVFYEGKTKILGTASENGGEAVLSDRTSPTETPTPTLSPTPTTSTPTPTPTPAPTLSPTPHPSHEATEGEATPSPTPAPATYPAEQVQEFISRFAGQYGVSEHVLRHIAQCESGMNPLSTNGPYAGIFQFHANTWETNRKAMGEPTDAHLRLDAEEAIQTAAFVFAERGGSAWPNCTP